MRIALTGRSGQIATALAERAGAVGISIETLSRPELDLERPETVLKALEAAAPEVIVSAAAYTQVDKAEAEPELAYAINCDGAGAVASAAAVLGVPLIHLSTDYVFRGDKTGPYEEDDATGPLSVYGASKLAGEAAVRGATADHAILRTAWVYSPFGNNFLKTMLRLAGSWPEVRVVADQFGCPTSALDISDAVLKIATNLCDSPAAELRGTFHLAGAGKTHWAGFAEEIFDISRTLGGPSASVVPITTAEYPTPARRPANSALSTTKLAATHGVTLPGWRVSTRETLVRLLQQPGQNEQKETSR